MVSGERGIALPLCGLVIPDGGTCPGTAGMRHRRIYFCFWGILLMINIIRRYPKNRSRTTFQWPGLQYRSGERGIRTPGPVAL